MSARFPLCVVASGALAVLAISGCASPPSAGGPPAQLAVEVLGGQPSVPQWLPATPPRVELVLDATPSMRRARIDGANGFEAARAVAVRALRDLPADTRVSLHVVGGPDGNALCTEGAGGMSSARGLPEVLAEGAERTTERSEASLAGALAQLAGSLATRGDTPRARIVVVSDLSQDCGGNLCVAARRLVAGGASFDWVLIGDGPAPGCLAALAPPAGPPRAIAAQPRPMPPRFSVTPRDAMIAGGAIAAQARVEGVADGTPIVVPSGLAFVGVDLAPPASFGPVALQPETQHRLRVVDFPSASPPAREWQIDALDERAAPRAPGSVGP